MNVLIYAPLAILGHHQETDLEIVQKHLDQGDNVYLVKCDGHLAPLEFMACTPSIRCNLCLSRCQQGLQSLKNTANLTVLTIEELKNIPIDSKLDLTSFEDIKAFTYKGNDIGSSYLSSLISDLRDPNPKMDKLIKKTKNNLQKLQSLVEYFYQTIEKSNPEIVYFFNGRFDIYRPLLRICQEKEINFYVHERGSSNKNYSLTKNNMPHDIATKVTEINSTWESAAPELRSEMGAKWFEDRAKGIMHSWHSFTDQQKHNALPTNWDDKKRNLSIFLSSEDEFRAVPGWELTLFDNQVHGIEILCQQYQNLPEFHFFVRMHPNLKGLKNDFIKSVKALNNRFENCTVISPESDISTYSLIKSSEKVLTFGSTTGVEATYWKKPSILLGKSLYAPLGACYTVKSIAEIFSLVEDKDLACSPFESSLKYGFWASQYGYDFKYYSPETLTTGKFNGVMITGSKSSLIFSYFFTFCSDFYRALRGKYSFWLLFSKIKSKLNIFKAQK